MNSLNELQIREWAGWFGETEVIGRKQRQRLACHTRRSKCFHLTVLYSTATAVTASQLAVAGPNDEKVM